MEQLLAVLPSWIFTSLTVLKQPLMRSKRLRNLMPKAIQRNVWISLCLFMEKVKFWFKKFKVNSQSNEEMNIPSFLKMCELLPYKEVCTVGLFMEHIFTFFKVRICMFYIRNFTLYIKGFKSPYKGPTLKSNAN